MSMYDKNQYNIVISLQLIKINEKKANTLMQIDIANHKTSQMTLLYYANTVNFNY